MPATPRRRALSLWCQITPAVRASRLFVLDFGLFFVAASPQHCRFCFSSRVRGGAAHTCSKLTSSRGSCLWKYSRRRRDWWTRPAEETLSRPAVTLSETSKGRYLSRVQRVKLRAPELRAHLDTVRLGFIPGGQLRTKRGSRTLTPQVRCSKASRSTPGIPRAHDRSSDTVVPGYRDMLEIYSYVS